MSKDYQPQIKTVRAQFEVSRAPSVDGLRSEKGLFTQYVARAIFDTAGVDSAGVSNKTVAAHGTGVFLPIGAILTRSYWFVKTAFTSVDSTATIAAKANSTADIYAATAVSGALGSTGFTTGIQDGTVTHMVSLTAERELVVSVAVEALTAGRAVLFVEYAIGE